MRVPNRSVCPHKLKIPRRVRSNREISGTKPPPSPICTKTRLQTKPPASSKGASFRDQARLQVPKIRGNQRGRAYVFPRHPCSDSPSKSETTPTKNQEARNKLRKEVFGRISTPTLDLRGPLPCLIFNDPRCPESFGIQARQTNQPSQKKRAQATTLPQKCSRNLWDWAQAEFSKPDSPENFPPLVYKKPRRLCTHIHIYV